MILGSVVNRTLFSAAILLAALLTLPLFILLPVSLTPKSYISIPSIDELSLRHFAAVLGVGGWWREFASSLLVAAASSTIAGCIGSIAAIGLWLATSRLAPLVRLIIIMPMMIPQVFSGLALFKLSVIINAYDSYWFVIASHSIISLPFVFLIVSVALSSLDIRLVQAARSSGANLRQLLQYVILPLNARAIASGMLLAFIISWDEIVVTLFVSRRNVYTVPRRIWDGIREVLDPSVAAAAVVMTIFTIGIFVLSNLVSRRHRSASANLMSR